jgi:F-type H+-transporting ATPase subunit delta
MPTTDHVPDALARVYASALFDLAKAGGGRDAIEHTQGELEDILELARQDRTFGEFLASRIVATEARSEALGRIFRGRCSDLTLRFLLTLNQKERLAHLGPIAAAFDELVQKEFGRVEVDVYTAEPAQAGELQQIKARLQEVLGREPVIHAYTDPKMIGGVKLQIGDQLLDGSVSTRLRQMRERLAGPGAEAIRSRITGLMN